MGGTNDLSFYVYLHEDPETNEILYIGHGWKHRAWLCDYPFRSEEHADYLQELHGKGFNPSNWVFIEREGLTKEEACFHEREAIKNLKPRFNKIQGEKLLKVTPELLIEAQELREQGWTYLDIANKFNLAAMTIHRAIKGKSPALEAVIERDKE
jgi:hypothetical protein